MTLLLEIACNCSYIYDSNFCYRIDDHGIIKVADFGLTEEVYANNYFKQLKDTSVASVKLPIKWMALESLHDGVFSEKSDVVSIKK